MGWADRHIERLERGEPVTFRPRGRSMEPRILDGQQVTVEPLGSRPLRAGDVVLCTVRGRQYLHLINAVQGCRFQIANNRGHINGWTRRVHGVLSAT